MKKLLSKLSRWGNIPLGTKWVILWKSEGKLINHPIDVTKAVEYRWQMIMKKRYPTKCEWCYRMQKDCKIVQVLKWKDEESKGLRNICPECRKLLGNEIRVTKRVNRQRSADELSKEMQKNRNLPLLTRTIIYDGKGDVVSDTIANHIDGTIRNTPSGGDKKQ